MLGEAVMTITVQAVFANGSFQPAQPVDLAEGTKVELTVHTADETDDPFEAVIGICDDGPDISLAARHDEFIYGPERTGEAKP
jgi:predicted DNA-binding antitoxin AbrB/MazE fold protein